jgi:hypothetical protein
LSVIAVLKGEFSFGGTGGNIGSKGGFGCRRFASACKDAPASALVYSRISAHRRALTLVFIVICMGLVQEVQTATTQKASMQAGLVISRSLLEKAV